MIKIEVVSYDKQLPTQALYAEFDELGGNIGRADGNALVLHDPERHISRIQAVVVFQEGQYYIRCLGSALPIYLNDQPLNNGEEAPIHNGDSIIISNYLMRVCGEEATTYSDQKPFLVHEDDPFAIFDKQTNDDQVISSSSDPENKLLHKAALPEEFISNSSGVETDPLAMVAPEPKDLIPIDFDPFAEPLFSNPDSAPEPSHKAQHIDRLLNEEKSMLASTGQPDAPSVDPLVLMGVEPDRGDESSRADHVPERQAAFKVPNLSNNQIPSSKRIDNESSRNAVGNSDELCRAFLKGAGVPELDVQFTPELMELVGQLLRESTQGTLDLLLARSLTKQEVRANVTLIAPRENNPLKFSPNVEAALKHLLSTQDRGFMTPLQAMKDAHDDLRAHQFGFMAGMRAALTGILERFDPQKLEQRFTHKNFLDTLFPWTQRAKLWDMFIAQYEDMSEEAKEDFHSLFGKEFLRAYEEQMVKLGQGEKKIR